MKSQLHFFQRVTLAFFLLLGFLTSAQTVQIGSGVTFSSTTGPSPVNNYYRSQHMQVVYSRSELNAVGITGGNIEKLGFYITSATSQAMPDYSIKLGHTTDRDANPFFSGPLDQVYYNSAYAPTAGGFDMLRLDTAWYWNGVDNIIVDICWDYGVQPSIQTGTVRTYNDSNYRISYVQSSAQDMCGRPTSSSSTVKPQIQFEFTAPAAADAAVSDITPHGPVCAGSQPIAVSIINHGTNVLSSASVNWSVNGVVQSPVNFAGSLAAQGGTATVNLGNFSFSTGTSYTIRAWTTLPNGNPDANPDNDSLSVMARGALNGIYTIGGGGANYVSFTAAVNALVANGICGPVTFRVANGGYFEQLNIPHIKGTGPSATITFESTSGDSSLVVLSNSSTLSTANYTMYLNGVDWITFRKITIESTNNSYDRVILIGDETSHLTFENNIIRNVAVSSPYNYRAVEIESSSNSDWLNFNRNYFLNGYSAIYNASSLADHLTFTFNNFINQQYNGLELYYNDFLIIEDNRIRTNNNSNFNGIFIYDSDSSISIQRNILRNLPYGSGIELQYCDGTASNPMLVANNFVEMGRVNASSYGIYIIGSGYVNVLFNTLRVEGINSGSRALFSNSNSNLTILNNNVSTESGVALYVTSGSNILASDHNNFYSKGTYMAYWSGNNFADLASLQTTSGKDSNSFSEPPYYLNDSSYQSAQVVLNNNGTPAGGITTDIEGEARNGTNPDIGADEFTPAANDGGVYAIVPLQSPFAPGNVHVYAVIRNFGSTTLTSLDVDWTVNGVAQSTVNFSGSLSSGDTAVIALGSVAFAIGTEYVLDAYSSSPNSTVDAYPGNDSSSLGPITPGLAGVYTIGGTSPDFTDFNSAVDALNLGGILDSVIFNVRDGSYNERIVLSNFARLDTADWVVFQSESLDSSAVTLTAGYTNTSENYVVKFEGAYRVTFNMMKIENSSTNTYSRAVLIDLGSRSLNFWNCSILSGNTSSSSTNVIHAYNSQSGYPEPDNLHFNECSIRGGYYALYVQGRNLRVRNLMVENCDFSEVYYMGNYLYYHQNLTLRNNTIRHRLAHQGSGYGLYLYDIHRGQVTGNKVLGHRALYGGAFHYCDGAVSDTFLIANNFFTAGGNNSSGYGLYVLQPTYILVANNSVWSTNSSATAAAYRDNLSGTTIRILNNIFQNTGGSYAIDLDNGSTGTKRDYNNLFTTGPNLAVRGSVVSANLAAWQADYGDDFNSISVNSQFVGMDDLHTNASALNAAATPLNLVPNDIDGDVRDPATPDIGADEFTLTGSDAALVDFDGPLKPFAAGNRSVYATLLNNGGDTLSSVTINWEVNGVLQSPFAWTGNLSSGQTEDSVNIGSFVFAEDTNYTLRAWVSMPNGVADILAANDTIQVSNLFAALAGIYTIGGLTPDFADFTGAAQALDQRGIASWVTFRVRDGIYNEAILIGGITGSSNVDTVLFESENNDSALVALKSNQSQPVLDIRGADWITFRDITIFKNYLYGGEVVRLNLGSEHIRFESCSIKDTVWTTSYGSILIRSQSGVNNNHLQVINSSLHGGHYGIYTQGTGPGEMGLIVRNSVFEQQYYYALYLTNQQMPMVTGNSISSGRGYSSFDGIYISSASGGITITNNIITNIRGNGMEIGSTSGSAINRSIIGNNFIHTHGTTNAGHGLYLYSNNYLDVVYNSVNSENTSSGTQAFNQSSNSNTVIQNNIFQNMGGGLAADIHNFTSLQVDYNNYYSNGANLIDYNNTTYATLAAYVGASGLDSNSLSVDAQFISPADFHVEAAALDGAATPFGGITTDLDGDLRDPVTPDIGADEISLNPNDAALTAFAAPKKVFAPGTQPVYVNLLNNGQDSLSSVQINWTVNGTPQTAFSWSGGLASGEGEDSVAIGSYNFMPGVYHDILVYTSLPNGQPDDLPLNDSVTVNNLLPGLGGIYTIGGITPDFPDFASAIQALNDGGVTGWVTFNVRDGVYNEQLTITEVQGASSSDSIVFQSENADSALVTLEYDGNSVARHTVLFDGSDFVSFRDMTLAGLDNVYNYVVQLNGNTHGIQFINCHFKMPVTTSAVYGVYAGNSLKDDLAIRNSWFDNGNTALYMQGGNGSGLHIENNTFRNQRQYGVYLYLWNAPVLMGNTATTNSTITSYIGFYLYDINNDFIIVKNRSHAPYGGLAYEFDYLDGTVSLRGLVANNFGTVGDSTASAGNFESMRFFGGSYTDIFYNSFHHASSNGSAILLQSNTTLDVRNNIFAATGGGYAMSSNMSPANFDALDYNDYYTTGTNLFNYTFSGIGTITTLALWQSQTGLDDHSVNADPLFVSDVDLHVNQAALDSAATPVAAVTDDIDGQLRDPATPDIGADEISFLSGDLSISAILTPVSGCALGDSARVMVTIANNGTDPQTGFDVTAVVNGDTTTETVGATINSGASLNYTFGPYYDLSTVGTYVIKVWSSLAGDVNAVNDTANKTVNHFAPPVISLTGDTTVCGGTSVMLTATGGINFFWSTGQTGPSITVAPNVTTTYSVAVTDANGCTGMDSTTVNISSVTDSIYIAGTTCDSNMVGTTVNTYVNQGGCDSVVYTVLTYSPSYQVSLPAIQICEGNSATIFGNSQSMAGTYYDTLPAVGGCDSILSQQLIVNNVDTTAMGSASICQGDSLLIFGNYQTMGGTYYSILTASNTCDSVLTFSLSLNPVYTVAATAQVCEGQSILLGGSLQSTAGTYYDTVLTAAGCDSVVVTTLTVKLIDSTSSMVGLINGDSIFAGGAYQFSSGVFYDVFTGSDGCDSVHETTVNFYAPAQSLSPSGNPGFTTAIINPLVGDPYTTFNFEVNFTDSNGILPPYGYPRIILDYEGNGIFNNTNDRTIIMQEINPLDTDPTDGKLYQASINGLAVGTNYQTIAQVIAGGNSTIIGPFNYPDVLAAPDLEIFASDISFSNPNPPVSSPLTITATIHNTSDYSAQNFWVHMENKCDTGSSFPDILVSNLPARTSTTVSWNITTPAMDAWCPVEVTVDHTNVIVESNELDNYAVRPFTNGNYNIPGAILVNATASPATLCQGPGRYVTVSGFAWYDDTAVPLLDSSVAGAQVDIIANGATYTTVTNSLGNFSLSIPAEYFVGNYTISGEVTDFTLTGPFSTGYQVINCACTLPDLRASISPSGVTIIQGNSTSGTVTIRNHGTAAAPATLTTVNQTGGVPVIPNQATPALLTDSTYSFGFSNIVFNTPGNYSICATADGGFTVAECSESNTACQTVTVLPNLPDLIPNGGPVNNQYVCNTGNPQFSIRNVGGVASGPFTAEVAISVNGGVPTLHYHQVANIPAQQSYSFSVPYTHLIPASYTYTLNCDTNVAAGGVVVEVSELNNVGVYGRQLYQCKPDLVLTGCKPVNVAPVDPVFPGMVTYSADVRNHGNDTAKAPILIRFSVAPGGAVYDTVINTDILPGQSVPVAVNVPSVAPATSTLTAHLDPLNTIDELVETNNVYTDNLCWDFEPVPTCGYNFWSGQHLVNTTTQLSVGVGVRHLYDASSVDVKFEVSGPGIVGTVDLGNATITNVSKTCVCPRVATLPTNFVFNQVGTYTFTMTVDPGGIYTECNEGNNVLVRSVQVVSKPDMRVLSQFIHPSNLNPDINEVVNINVTYENIGFSNINEQMALRLMVDNTIVGTISPVKGLVTGDNNTVAFPNIWSSFIPGAHVIRAIIDPFNVINEQDELNNEATRAIIVGEAANLFFADLSASNANPALGDTINLMANIGNNGDVDAQADVRFFYIDNNMDTIPIGLVPVSVDKHDSAGVQFTWVVLDPITTIVAKIVNTNTLEFLYTDNTGTVPLGAYPVSIVSTPSCFGGANGSLTATASGGVPPYTYQWSTNHIGQVLTAGPGTYGLTVTDNLGQMVFASGVIDTIPGSLTILPVQYVCAGDSVLIFGEYQSGIGNYYDTLTGSGGCDSILKISLRYRETNHIQNSTASICEGDSILLFGSWRNTAGTYYDTLSNQYGCDSIISQPLVVNPIDSIFIQLATTNPALNGTTTTSAYINQNGCDSIVTIQLIYQSQPCSTIDRVTVNLVTCDSTQADTTIQVLVGSDGCDSIVTTITVYDPGSLQALPSMSICDGETAVIFGNVVSMSGTYYDTLTNVNGCDSVLTLTLNVLTPTTGAVSKSICDGDSILLGGALRTTAGVYVDTLTGTNGCDSVLTTTLSIKPTYSVMVTDSVCPGDSLFLGGVYQTAAGTYVDILPAANGCDSVVTTSLTLRTDSGCVQDTAVQACLTVVSDAGWMKSSVTTPVNLSGYWPGVNNLPGAGTFNIPVNLGQPYGYPGINLIEGTEVISTTNSVTYFRKEFSLTHASDLNVRLLVTVDDQADIYLNGHRVALITSFGRPNYKYPAHDIKYFSNGTVINGFMGGDMFNITSSADMDTLLNNGVNEVILAVRNLGKPNDKGGFSFRMDINCADTLITKKSAEADAEADRGLIIFPNPVGDVLSIWTDLAITSATLFDLSGKLFYSAGFDAEKRVEISTADLPKGVYLIRVEEVGGQISTFKIIKQ